MFINFPITRGDINAHLIPLYPHLFLFSVFHGDNPYVFNG